MAFSLVATAMAGIAWGAHDEGLFELDGNAVDDAFVDNDPPEEDTGVGEDWDTYFSGANPTFDENDGDALAGVFIKDTVGAGDDALQTGGSKDINDLTEWVVDPDFSTPDKDDLDNAYALAYEDSNDEIVVYFGTDRFATEGDAKVGFWFLQGDFALTAGTGGNLVPTTDHTDGDILIQSNFTNGGAISNISVYEWHLGLDGNADGQGGDEDNLELIESGTACDTPGTHEACAIVNTESVTAPWPHIAKGTTDTSMFPTASFFEGGLNLSHLLADAPASCFSTFMATTRSSQEPTAQLKDIAVGSFDLCGGIDITKNDTSDPANELSGATFAVYEILAETLDTSWDEPLSQATLDALVASDDLAEIGTCTSDATETDECSFDDLLPGDYLVVETAPPTGYDLSDPNWQIVSVERFKRTAVTFTNPRIPYAIDVTPNSDVNPNEGDGLDHEFLVRLWSDWTCDMAEVVDTDGEVPSDADGGCTGASPLNGETVDLQWVTTDDTGAITDIDSGTIDTGGQTGTCTTGEVTWNEATVAGACIVTVTAAAAGSGTLEASYTLPYADLATTGSMSQGTNYDSGTGEGALVESIEDEGDKVWRGYDVTIDPKATNLLGIAHTFDVSVTETGPGADTSPEGVIVVVDWDGPTDSTVTGDGTAVPTDPITSDPLGDAACTTDANGDCSFTVDSDTNPGTGTLTVVALVGNLGGTWNSEDGWTGGTSFTTFPSDVSTTKTWTDYDVDVDGPAVNLVGSPHTFTVHVQKDYGDGAGFVDYEGAVFSTDTEDDSYITISSPATFVEGEGTCFDEGTNSSGECTVVVTSSSTTLATLDVVFEGAEGSESAIFTTDTTKRWIDYRVDVDPDTDDNLTETNHTFTVTIELDFGDGEGFQPLPDAVPTIELDGLGEIVTNGCSAGTDENGQCEVVITSDVAGQSTLTATYTGTAEGDVNDETDTESAEFTDPEGPAEKNWVDYELVMSEDAVNPIGTTHTFTATLTKATTSDESGSIFVIAPNEELVFSIEGVGTVIDIVDGTVDADGLGGTCITDENGQCDIVIQSDETGQTTVTAEYFAVVGDTTGTFDDDAVKLWGANPAISLVKTGSTTEAELGELVTYTYLITNTGDVRLDFVTLDDEIEVSGLFADLLNLLLPSAELSLEPGESVEFESTYLVTSDDFPGPIDNVAETTGTAPDGTVVRDDDDWSVTVLGDPAIELIKEADLVPDASGIKNVTASQSDPGATTITYTYTVTNVGNVPLSGLTLTDYVLSEVPDNPIGDYSYDEALAAFDGTLITVDLPVDTLAPGATTVGVATFTVRDVDVANALINNVAEVNGTDAAGTTVSDDDPETVFITVVLPAVIEKPLPATGISVFELLLYGLLAGGLGLILVYVLPQTPVVARRREDD